METAAINQSIYEDDNLIDDYTSLQVDELVAKKSYTAKYDPNNQFDVLPTNSYSSVPKVKSDQFNVLQKWEGVVTGINFENFSATLYDRSEKNIDEEASFSIDDVSDQDLDLLKEGAIFYWSIGYLEKSSGQRMRSSIMRFRRLPFWSEIEIEAASKEAENLLRDLNIES